MLNLLPYYMMRSLLLTLAVELAAAVLFGFRRRDLLFVGLVNVLTNPLLNVTSFLTGFFFGTRARICVVIALEIAVVAAEGLIYLKTLEKRRPHPLLLSLLLNALSYSAGLAVNALF